MKKLQWFLRQKCKNEVKETNNKHHWPPGTCAIVCGSMVKSIDEKRLYQKHDNIKSFNFLSARIEDINHDILPTIFHIGTNDVIANTTTKIINDLFMLKPKLCEQLPDCWILISKPIIQNDHQKGNLSIRNNNKHLSALQRKCSKNDNINAQHLEDKGLYLNPKGKGRQVLIFSRQNRIF